MNYLNIYDCCEAAWQNILVSYFPGPGSLCQIGLCQILWGWARFKPHMSCQHRTYK